MANPAYQKLKDMNALPSPTGVGLEILRLASDEKATLGAIAAVIEADPALAGRMLKLVNSPFAGVPRQIASVSTAVQLLGLRTVKSLSLGLSLVSGSRNGPCKAFNYETFWSESLGRAVAARQIAGQLKNFPPDETFAAGLVSKIGLLALATAHPEEYARLLDAAGGSAALELVERERQAFGIDHNELSAEMMAEWRLQEYLCEAVRSQDSPKRADSDPASQAGQLARTLHLAGAIASVFVQPQTHLEMLTALAEEASGLGIAKETFDQLFDSIGNEWREAGAIFSMSTRDMQPLEELRARAAAAVGPASDCSTRSETNPGAAKTGTDAPRIVIVDDDRMRSAVAANAVKSNGDEWSTTISAGVAERAESMWHPDELLKAADEMLYAAKQAGGNRVCLAGAPIAPEPREPKRAKTTKQRCARPAAAPGSPPVSILVVDDDAQIRVLYRKLLECEGYVVSEAKDGLDALQEVSACSPDVIVLDAMMPNLDGFECARRLKADVTTREIPIIMVSAANDPEGIEAGLEAGVDEYLTKPFRHREFVLRVRSMVRLHRSKAELLSINHARWEQARSLQALLDLSVGLIGAENLDGILERVVSAVADLARCRRVSVMLPDSEGKFLTIAKCVGLDEATAGTVRVPVGGAIAGQVFLSGEQVVVNSPEDPNPRPEQYDSQFFVSAPLISKTLRAMERTVGVLNITERHGQRPFGRNELESIDLLCNIAGTAINDFLSRQERDEAQDSIVVALAALAECRDTDTGGHLDRVTRFALMLAEELRNKGPYGEQIDDAFMQALRRAMPLHDIGKVGVPDHILLKPGRLTDAEMEQMRRHAEIGAQTIRSVTARTPGVSFLRIAEEIACSHHEWWDGSGYPHGLSGRSIPLSGRIAAIADVYDALTTKRVYKDAMPHQRAVAIIREGAGTQFDPAVVEAFLRRQDEFAPALHNSKASGGGIEDLESVEQGVRC